MSSIQIVKYPVSGRIFFRYPANPVSGRIVKITIRRTPTGNVKQLQEIRLNEDLLLKI
jgi:hypothetical protein